MIAPRTLLSSPHWVLQELFGADRVVEVHAGSSTWRIVNRQSLQRPETDFLKATVQLVLVLRALFPRSELCAADSPLDMEIDGLWTETGRQRWLLPENSDIDKLVSDWLVYDAWSLCWPAGDATREAGLQFDPDRLPSVRQYMASCHLT